MQTKISNEMERFLAGLRGQHPNIDAVLSDPGLYGAMSNYTGQSHLYDAVAQDLGRNSLIGAGVGALSAPILFPLLGMATPGKVMRHGAVAGLVAGALGSGLSDIFRYYAGKGAGGIGGE